VTTLTKRIEGTLPLLECPDAVTLLGKIRAVLKKATDQDLLQVPQHDIFKYVRIVEAPREVAAATTRAARAIIGGIKDFKRRRASKHLVRADGEKQNEPLELVAYDFELVYDEGHVPPYIRFDLNQHGHRNEFREIRSHMHPGSEKILVPLPILNPLEALDLMMTLPMDPLTRGEPAVKENTR
jgi:hypothetical protein